MKQNYYFFEISTTVFHLPSHTNNLRWCYDTDYMSNQHGPLLAFDLQFSVTSKDLRFQVKGFATDLKDQKVPAVDGKDYNSTMIYCTKDIDLV